MKANILYTNFHREDGGGQTTYILSLLKNSQHNKFVACPATSLLYKTLQDQGYDKLIPIEFPGKFRQRKDIIKNMMLLKKAIIENDIDIVHNNGSPDNRMALYVSWITRKKFKVVFTKHNMIKFNNIVSKLRLNWFNDASIFVNDFFELLDLNKDNPRYYVIPNGLDLEYWKKQTPVQTGQRLTLISNAGASRHKGWHHLLEAIKGLTEEERQRLSVVMLARHEEEMAKELAEAESICDFSRPGFFTDIRPYLEQADIGFVLSYKEACSFASREMLAMNLPVIVSDHKSLLECAEGGCGWVTAMKNADSIRDCLRSILAMSPEEINAMKYAARKKAEAEFSLETMIAKTNQVYADVMKR